MAYAVLILLDFQLRPVFEAPLDDVCLFTSTFNVFALGDGRPTTSDVSMALNFMYWYWLEYN